MYNANTDIIHSQPLFQLYGGVGLVMTLSVSLSVAGSIHEWKKGALDREMIDGHPYPSPLE